MKQYILADGKGNYITYDRSIGRYRQANRMEDASRFDSFDKSERTRKCSIGKHLKHKYYTVTIETRDAEKTNLEKQIHNMDDQTVSAVNAMYAKTANAEDDPILSFMEFAKSMLLRKDELSEKRSTIDKEVADLQHYIEQRNLNACDGYKAYKRLQGILIRRRAIKDEQLVLSIIEDCRMEPDSIEKTIKRIQGMDDRKYKPRVLTELFNA